MDKRRIFPHSILGTMVSQRFGSLQPQSREKWILLLGAVLGSACFIYYYSHGLTTAHYDAKARLVVARRIFDSITPGYDQIGSNWLPLLQLTYLPLVMMDSQYQTGLLPSLISVFAYALSGWLVYRIAYRVTESSHAAVFAAVILLANGNLQYLQSCPLTEPVFMALMLLSMDSLLKWRHLHRSSPPWMTAIWASLAALCRYEGWYFVGGIVLIFAYDFITKRTTQKCAIRAAATVSGLFAIMTGAHFGFIFYRLRESFFHKVIGGNPAPYLTYKKPFLALVYHLTELGQIAGIIPLLAGISGVVYFALRRDKWHSWMPLLLLWFPSLTNISALFWGLVYRVRYSVLLLPAIAIFAALPLSSEKATKRIFLAAVFVAMLLPWIFWSLPESWRHEALSAGPGMLILPLAALVIFSLAVLKSSYVWALLALCVLGMQTPVLEGENRPILAETLEHGFIEPERQLVLQYLRDNYDGTPILIDMGKLAPLIYDSRLPIRSFVYNEGNSTRWHRAFASPRSEVGWLCAQMDDDVWRRLQVDPHWADGYSLALQTKYFLLYRIDPKFRDELVPDRTNH